MQKRKRANFIWSIVALIISLILFMACGMLLAFAFMGYENGDYPVFGNNGIYAVYDSADIIPENRAVITDTSVQLERGCPVVFVNEELKTQNKMDILYLYDWDEAGENYVLADESAQMTFSVGAENLRGRAFSSIPFVGWLLGSIGTVYGICVLLLIVCLFAVSVILLIRGIIKLRKHADEHISGDEEAEPEHKINQEEQSEPAEEAEKPIEAEKPKEAKYAEEDEEEEDADDDAAEEVKRSETAKGRINDDLSFEIDYSGEEVVITFSGEAADIQKLGKLVTAAALKNNANSINTKENFAEVSTLEVRADKQDAKLILSVIKLLKNKAEK